MYAASGSIFRLQLNCLPQLSSAATIANSPDSSGPYSNGIRQVGNYCSNSILVANLPLSLRLPHKFYFRVANEASAPNLPQKSTSTNRLLAVPAFSVWQTGHSHTGLPHKHNFRVANKANVPNLPQKSTSANQRPAVPAFPVWQIGIATLVCHNN